MTTATPPRTSAREPLARALSVPRLSLLDDLLFNLTLVLPGFLQGSFSRRPLWVSLFSRLHPDPLGVRLGARLRRRYRDGFLSLHVLTTRSLLVLDAAGIREVLERSPWSYAEPRFKRRGMSHFQPHAVTLSRGEEWRERRRFNEAVLESTQRVHTLAGRLLELVDEEVRALHAQPRLEWPHFERLFDRLTLGFLFGREARGAQEQTQRLERMMRESNRGFALGRSRYFEPFYAQLRAWLAAPAPETLVERCRQVPSTERTRVENQIPHWMFAMRDTLALNTMAALALLLSHPRAEARVRQELQGGEPLTPERVDGLRFLEGCVQEGMRLWPTTAILVREAVTDDTLRGRRVEAGTQVLILNGFNHRDRSAHAFADRFTPEYWLDDKVDFLFNHLSNGPQVCAGKPLALFLAKAVLARLLQSQRYTLRRPRLAADQPLPHAFNPFRVRLEREGSTSG